MVTLILQRSLQKHFPFIISQAQKSIASSTNKFKIQTKCVAPTRSFNCSAHLFSKVLYTNTHEWIRIDQDVGTIGITDFAQDQLGDIAYCGLPDSGTDFEKGECFATIESVKAASDLYMPVTAKVVEVNEALNDSPAIINESPFDKGWLIKVKIAESAMGDLDELLDEKRYEELKSSEDSH